MATESFPCAQIIKPLFRRRVSDERVAARAGTIAAYFALLVKCPKEPAAIFALAPKKAVGLQFSDRIILLRLGSGLLLELALDFPVCFHDIQPFRRGGTEATPFWKEAGRFNPNY